MFIPRYCSVVELPQNTIDQFANFQLDHKFILYAFLGLVSLMEGKIVPVPYKSNG
jgi:hypothetical protein